MIVTVGPSGRDYTSLAAAEAGEQQDLTALGESCEFECDAFTENADISIDGWTTNASNRVIIRSAGSARPGPTYAASSCYRLNGTATVLNLLEAHCSVERIAVRSTQTSWRPNILMTAAPQYVDDCLLVRDAVGSTGPCVDSQCAVGLPSRVRNCIGISNGSGAVFQHNGGGSGTVMRYMNCTAIGGAYGFLRSFGNADARNCLSSGASTAAWSGTWESTSDYNASSDATAPGANSRTSQTFTFVDSGSGNYRLSQSDTGGRAGGTDLSSDATFPFSTDFDGDTRTVPWDIGADQYVAAGGGPTEQAVAGTITPSGTLTLQIIKSPSGSIAPSAALTRAATKLFAGTTTPSGTLQRQPLKLASGSLTPAGELAAVRALLQSVAGTLTPAGALQRAPAKLAAGTVAPAGALTRDVSKVAAGTVSPIGTLTKASTRALSGSVTITGALTALRSTLRAVAGTLGLSGAVTALRDVITQAVTGAIALSGTLVKRAGKQTAGTVTPSGAVTRAVWKRVDGTLAVAGVVQRQPQKRFSATLPLTGVTVTVAGTFAAPGPHPLTIRFERHGKTIAFELHGKRLVFVKHQKTIDFEP